MQDLNVITVKIETLKTDPENARKHSEKNLSAIAKSLEKFGQRKPIVVWQGFVIAGNGTLEAARQLGWTDISITTAPHDWSHEEARAYAIADNRTSELAEWDDYLLANQLIELDAVGWDIADFGFEPLTPPQDILEAPEEETIKRVFRLTQSQAAFVDSAMDKAKTKTLPLDGNNVEANALTLICQEWLS